MRNKNFSFLFGVLAMLSLGTVLTCFDALPRAVAIFLMVVGWACCIAHGFYSLQADSLGKRVGYVFMVAWFVVVGVAMAWGQPAWAKPSAGELRILVELLLFGFVAAFGIGLLVEIWQRQVRRGPYL